VVHSRTHVGASRSLAGIRKVGRLESVDVVLVGITGMLSDIVKGILDEPDIRVAGELSPDAATADQIARVGADVVIFNTPEIGLPATARALLVQGSRLKVLTIRDDGRATSLYELRPYETTLGQVSPETLLAAVRTARTSWL
jgi:DNA-binding NarL/FixJ family response regulator